MLRYSYARAGLLVACALSIAGCGGEPTNSTAAAVVPSPSDTLAEVIQAYSSNAIQAKRTWGGKQLTLAGKFDSAGRNPDGTTSILLNAGSMVGLGEFVMTKNTDDFVAKLSKDHVVTLSCTVDPEKETMATTFLACSPAT